jgi:hypothetical protein
LVEHHWHCCGAAFWSSWVDIRPALSLFQARETHQPLACVPASFMYPNWTDDETASRKSTEY